MRCYFCQTNIEQNKYSAHVYFCTECPKGHVSHAFTVFDEFDQPLIAHIYVDKLHDHNPSPGGFTSAWQSEEGKYHIRLWLGANLTEIGCSGKNHIVGENDVIASLPGFPITIDNAYERLLTVLTFL